MLLPQEGLVGALSRAAILHGLVEAGHEIIGIRPESAGRAGGQRAR